MINYWYRNLGSGLRDSVVVWRQQGHKNIYSSELFKSTSNVKGNNSVYQAVYAVENNDKGTLTLKIVCAYHSTSPITRNKVITRDEE